MSACKSAPSLSIDAASHGLRWPQSHALQWTCQCCERCFPQNYVIGINSAVKKKQHSCRYCGKWYWKDYTCITGTGERAYICTNCGREYCSSDEFYRHVRIHIEDEGTSQHSSQCVIFGTTRLHRTGFLNICSSCQFTVLTNAFKTPFVYNDCINNYNPWLIYMYLYLTAMSSYNFVKWNTFVDAKVLHVSTIIIPMMTNPWPHWICRKWYLLQRWFLLLGAYTTMWSSTSQDKKIKLLMPTTTAGLSWQYTYTRRNPWLRAWKTLLSTSSKQRGGQLMAQCYQKWDTGWRMVGHMTSGKS